MATMSGLLLMTANFVAQVKRNLAMNDNNEIQVHVYFDMNPYMGKMAVVRLLNDAGIKSRGLKISYNSLTQELAIVAPCNVFNALFRWIRFEIASSMLSEIFTPEEMTGLQVSCGTTFGGFTAPYQDSAKAPDIYIRPKGGRLPPIVIQTGWSEAARMLMADKDLWIIGAPQTTKLVLIVVWTRISNNDLEAILLAFRPGKPCKQYPIFPAPEPGSVVDEIFISRDELFGDAIPVDRKPADMFTLSISRLRNLAEGQVRANGYIPVGQHNLGPLVQEDIQV